MLCFVDGAFVNVEVGNGKVLAEGFSIVPQLVIASISVIVAVCKRHGLNLLLADRTRYERIEKSFLVNPWSVFERCLAKLLMWKRLPN